LTKIADCQTLTVRAKTLPEVWNSTEPTFNAVRKELGPLNLKKLLFIEIGKMIALLKADLQEIQIEYMAQYITQHYSSYTISDITAFTDSLMRSKLAESWGRPSMQNLIFELDQYSIEKQEFAVEQRIKENSKHKADHLKEDKFTKMYAEMKAKAKAPKTQKQKDAEAKQRNEQKIYEMKRQGLL
jgi:hypothetical protein